MPPGPPSAAAGFALPGPALLPVGGPCSSSGTVFFPGGDPAYGHAVRRDSVLAGGALPYLRVSWYAAPSPSCAAATGSAAGREAPRPARSLRAPATPTTLAA